MIYVIIDDVSDYIKVGYTTNMLNRLRSIQSGNPRELSIIRLVEGSRADEIALHKLLMFQHKYGEWFEASEASLAVIDNYIESLQSLPIDKSKPKFRKIRTGGSREISLVRMALTLQGKRRYKHNGVEVYRNLPKSLADELVKVKSIKKRKHVSISDIERWAESYRDEVVPNMRKYILKMINKLAQEQQEIFKGLINE